MACSRHSPFRKTGAELVSNGIVGRDLGTKQKVTSIDLYNTGSRIQN